MLEVTGNLFTYNPIETQLTPNNMEELLNFKPSSKILRCVTTNGIVKTNGDLVMGSGIAKEAKRWFRELPHILGDVVDSRGNHAYIIEKYGIASFPTKHHWKNNSDPNLIARSCREILHFGKKWEYILLPRVGCNNGGLGWEQVKPILLTYFQNDKFIVVHSYKK